MFVLRLRYSQWRFANARAEGVRYIQRLIAEETLYNVWHATSGLRDIVTTQRICLQQMKLEIKLDDILNKQVDLRSLKLDMSSALDVMHAMGSSIWSLHCQMEEINRLASDLAVIATKENLMLGRCENMLASTAIEESSLMTHLMQKKQEEEEMIQSLYCCH
ncbi:unnamed protein product [Eruca vesicaria subsp. sativa]|uniref:Uncharacterized protein n=1 Tax=Eruca vesicaria subsp. sativa TaxID=29727 RepID=A0ABC8KFB5_ERUVS|nr:unnamed protein product [Eruca vesicaria subsp. sativa]